MASQEFNGVMDTLFATLAEKKTQYEIPSQIIQAVEGSDAMQHVFVQFNNENFAFLEQLQNNPTGSTELIELYKQFDYLTRVKIFRMTLFSFLMSEVDGNQNHLAWQGYWKGELANYVN